MSKHNFVSGSDGYCSVMVAGTHCGFPEQALVHQDVPPVRTEAARRPRERQDF